MNKLYLMIDYIKKINGFEFFDYLFKYYVIIFFLENIYFLVSVTMKINKFLKEIGFSL